MSTPVLLMLVLCISCVVSQPTACSPEEEDGEECRQISGEERLTAILDRLHDKLERLEQKVDDGMKKSEVQLMTLQQKVDDGMKTLDQKMDRRFEATSNLLGSHINLALGKSAFQSTSEYRDDLSGPGNAVDGDNNPVLDSNSCTHTKNDPNPWWAVDLGDSYAISSVVISNRNNIWHVRLHDIVIGVTNTSPLDETPALTNYRRCTRHDPVVPEAVTISLTCDSGPMRGRYVIVQLDQNPQYLSLCEVQVFADFSGDL